MPAVVGRVGLNGRSDQGRHEAAADIRDRLGRLLANVILDGYGEVAASVSVADAPFETDRPDPDDELVHLQPRFCPQVLAQ